MRCHRQLVWVASLAVWCLFTSAANAQLMTDFEAPAYTGSAAGTAMSGQQGWYVPVAGGAPYNVHTYTGNALMLPANPTGGAQFVGAIGPGPAFARTQLDTSFTGFPQWTISYDVAHRYNGTLPAAQNLASFSTQAATVPRQVIALHTWTDPATATNWNANFNVSNAAGAAATTMSPGPAWTNLILDRWYRESLTFDFTGNRVTRVSITDLTTGVTNIANPVDWYLSGGATGLGAPIPTGIRFFTGSGTPGNVAGFDNLSIVGAVPEPSSLILLGTGIAGALGVRRRRKQAQAAVVAETPSVTL